MTATNTTPIERVRGFLAGLDVGEARERDGMQVFPLYGPESGRPSYALLDDLLLLGAAEVVEVDEHGRVSVIKIINRADIDVLIPDGLELRGAKQNRMVNVTIIAGRKTETEIPVSCVERGRWAHRSTGFKSAQRTVGGKLRAYKARMVGESFKRSGRAETNQSAVWESVDKYLRDSGAIAPTSALDEAFVRHERRVEVAAELAATIEANGMVVAIGGEIVGADVFDCKATFSAVSAALLRGWALDSVLDSSSEKSVGRSVVQSWIASLVRHAELEPHPVPGIGGYWSISGAALAGGIACVEDRVVHASFFAAEPD